LSGRIRVSVVVTGIDDSATPMPKKNNMSAYVEIETPVAEVAEPMVVADDENMTTNEATATEEETSVDSNVIDFSSVRESETPRQEEFASMKSDEPVAEPHVSSSLFNAIINKPVVANAEDSAEVKSELSEIKIEKPFAPTSAVRLVEDEPQLFPEQGEAEQPFERVAREEAQAMIEEEPAQPARQRFIDKILGISRAKAKKAAPKPVSVPKFDEIEDFAEKESANEDDLEIPSFLRRR
ncbi:MAG: hypothetical protein J6W96_01980, partial [Alphaproteobacteria bacterium]|nr:hypothetical protein [Alphaproteobacteria bacterium]